MQQKLKQGVVHTVPSDIERALRGTERSVFLWNALTPLGRNEWICWVVSVKREETRSAHIVRMLDDLSKGKKRPCCWAGCSHR